MRTRVSCLFAYEDMLVEADALDECVRFRHSNDYDNDDDKANELGDYDPE